MSKVNLQEAIKGTIIKCKKILLVVGIPVCTECLNELCKQQVIDEIVYRKKLLEDKVRKLTWDNTVGEGEMIINKRTGEILGPEVGYTYNSQFQSNFTVFQNNKITCCKAVVFHALNDIDILDTCGTCDLL